MAFAADPLRRHDDPVLLAVIDRAVALLVVDERPSHREQREREDHDPGEQEDWVTAIGLGFRHGTMVACPNGPGTDPAGAGLHRFGQTGKG